MGLGLVMLSVIFLCNPMVGFIDILPDCIGFLLIFNGLRFLADLDDHLEAARKWFLILFWAGVAQFLIQFLVYNFMQGKNGEEIDPRQLPNTVLFLAFTWMALYLLALIPAFRKLFLGLNSLCDRFGYKAPMKSPHKSSLKRDAGDRMSIKTAVCIFVIAVMSFLPELASIQSLSFSEGKSRFSFDWYEFIGMFRSLAVILSIGFSIAWLISFLSYFGRLKRDRQWIERMRAQYRTEVLPQTGMLAMRLFSNAFLILYVGIIFAINLKMSFYSCLPGFVFAILVFAGISSLGEILPPQKNTYIAGGALAVSSVAQMIVNHFYLKSYLPEESLYHPTAFWHYLMVQLLEIAETVFTVLLIAYLLQTLNEVVKVYTGVRYGGEESKQLSHSATQKLHASFRIRLYVIFVLFFIAAIGNIADVVLHFYFGWLWLISLCFSILGVFFYQSLQHDLLEEIRFRYQSEEAYPKE
jgi:hypothetical protein